VRFAVLGGSSGSGSSQLLSRMIEMAFRMCRNSDPKLTILYLIMLFVNGPCLTILLSLQGSHLITMVSFSRGVG
jgi:hypothetical protein